MKKLIYIFLLLILVSCTPQKRLQRLLNHHPELIQIDTIFYKDTILINEVKLDTIFENNFDTIFFEKENIKIQLIKKDSLIYLSAKKITDTIFINKSFPVEKIIYKQEPFKFKNIHIFYFLLIIVILLLFSRILELIIKRK